MTNWISGIDTCVINITKQTYKTYNITKPSLVSTTTLVYTIYNLLVFSKDLLNKRKSVPVFLTYIYMNIRQSEYCRSIQTRIKSQFQMKEGVHGLGQLEGASEQHYADL